MSKSLGILLVEDNPADADLMVDSLELYTSVRHVHVARDGVEAVAFLRRLDPYAGSFRPDLILLDLNLPKRGGLEVLEEVKADPRLQSIPVTVLTSSTAERDIIDAYMRHANCYVAKPVDLNGYVTLAGVIQKFWMETVILPTTNGTR